MSDGRLALANAIQKKAIREGRRQQAARRGNVTGLDPLQIVLYDYAQTLTIGEDFFLTAWAQWYQAKIGFQVDDVVLVHVEDDWLLFDVLGDAEPQDIADAMNSHGVGGDLSGSLPDPTVATVLGGETPMTRGESAGGDLAGTYPNPTVPGVFKAATTLGGDLSGTLPNPEVATVLGGLVPLTKAAALVSIQPVTITVFANGWGTYATPWSPVRYYQDAFGIVHLEGLLYAASGYAAYVSMFSMPAALAPTVNQIFGQAGDGVYLEMRVLGTGSSTPGLVQTGQTPTVNAGAYVSVAGISWLPAANEA